MSKLNPILIYNFLGMLSSTYLFPVINSIYRELGLEDWHAGLIASVSGTFWMLSSRFWGNISDNKGRKLVLLITISIFMLSYLLLSIFIDLSLTSTLSVPVIVTVFIILRSFMALSYSGVPTVSTAYVADITDTGKRTQGMALLTASNSLSIILGSLSAGLIAKKSLILPLYIGAIIPILCILVVLFSIPKTQNNSPIKNEPVKLSDKRLRLPILSSLWIYSCIYAANICVGFYTLDVLNLDVKIAAQTSGYVLGILGIFMVIIQVIVSKLNSITPKQWLQIGTLINAIGFTIVITFTTVNGLYIGYAIAAIGMGAIIPSIISIASHSVNDDEQGIAAGSITAAQGLAMVVSPILSTIIYEINPFYPYITSIFLLIVVFFYTLDLFRN